MMMMIVVIIIIIIIRRRIPYPLQICNLRENMYTKLFFLTSQVGIRRNQQFFRWSVQIKKISSYILINTEQPSYCFVATFSFSTEPQYPSQCNDQDGGRETGVVVQFSAGLLQNVHTASKAKLASCSTDIGCWIPSPSRAVSRSCGISWWSNVQDCRLLRCFIDVSECSLAPRAPIGETYSKNRRSTSVLQGS